MSVRVAVRHETRYEYDRLVSLSPHVIRLRPAPHSRTPVEAYSLRVKPDGYFLNWQQDPFGNFLARVVFPEKVRTLEIDVELIADVNPVNPFDFFLEPSVEQFPFEYEPAAARSLRPYLETMPAGPLLSSWLAGISRERQPLMGFLVGVNRRVQEDVAYTIRLEAGVQSPEETLEKRLGSCRDSGWLLVQVFRHLGLAARFVSGYSIQLAPDEKPLDGPAGPPSDATDLHAWAEVYVPGAGWIGLDPTSGLLAAEGHIPLACTPDPSEAAPITGATDPCEVRFQYRNEVRRIREDPRVTKPYADADWDTILAVGRAVDAELAAGDVRLTMGGEPTFVGIDHRDEPEWNTAADGEHKRERAAELVRRLGKRFAPGGVLHHGQGKWYPGEPLPRWAFHLFWRKDGKVVWSDPALLADPTRPGNLEADQGREFLESLADFLHVPRRSIHPAYEDVAFWIVQEGNLPVEIDPERERIDDPFERRRLLELLERGLGRPTGWVLPLARELDGTAWRSDVWRFRRGHLFLVPGDSPIGLRLPLDSLEERELAEAEPERSGLEPTPPLPDHSFPKRLRVPAGGDGEVERRPLVRTALGSEVRDGHLRVFLPPLGRLESWIELVAAVEATAREIGTPVVLEGYEPPRDVRLERLSVTPDPGVIEVNVHPASNWEELVERTDALYEEAREARLATEKFLLDGRHTGTGGGNHVTLGGPTPADSPVLRRPDLLRSFVTYWQHHPGLSYLFSGMFLGPTSQAPRVDEGRDEQLYELEIAFDEMPAGEVDRPWLVDRLLRNFLVDLTGNTHRAEFSIDKLYSPDSWSGRLGLVELRAFEMPPHARMSLVQMLLLRALVARFWKAPYRGRLVRWGTELHDRFLLPHWAASDVREVAADLREHGIPFLDSWLDPFVEFRFPPYGSVRIRDLELELRMALEPWHVLGEETTAHGTARCVDSSLERLQVRATGFTDSRYVVTCNGRRLSLRATGTHGEFVGGVRYKAWNPHSALHPTIGVHTPLVFDVIDTWNARSIGGCTYHVSHPGGRTYEVAPVNAAEAAARRMNRFFDRGHTPGPLPPLPGFERIDRFFPEGSPPGPMDAPPEEVNPEFPNLLDLRRSPR